ncbi:MAG: acetyl-CoA C-acyltransferase [Bacteroidetes bacterium]|jgi:acetyl-CoA acyltransferase|nr:acetyl-CoA C-acyltransferase [Bacteroidota bacterium]MDA0931372.1 acetyl-CoA C-acyltransferase [Bacteroidota bacterium]
METAYIIDGYRTAVGKAPRGTLRSMRADDLGAQVVRHLMAQCPQLDPSRIDDVMVGNATPEAEQGLNIGRMISLMGLSTDAVPGLTINRYCASGLETIALAAARIRSGMADCIIAGGVETMSPIPFGGWRLVPNPAVAKAHPDWYWGMGLTAEEVARRFAISREDQDVFSWQSHQKALKAQEEGWLNRGIVPIEVEEVTVVNGKKQAQTKLFQQDEGPRADTTLEALAGLKPVFDAKGSVTAGNSSQTSDGAAFVLLMSERFVKELGLQPRARFVAYHVVGLEPAIMGMGPVQAVPGALKKAGIQSSDLNLIELNEAFASQSLAVLRELNLNPDLVNVHGGAIALGHPLGCTGAKLTVQIMNELERRNQRYGLVTMCVGTGQGAAGIIERI